MSNSGHHVYYHRGLKSAGQQCVVRHTRNHAAQHFCPSLCYPVQNRYALCCEVTPAVEHLCRSTSCLLPLFWNLILHLTHVTLVHVHAVPRYEVYTMLQQCRKTGALSVLPLLLLAVGRHVDRPGPCSRTYTLQACTSSRTSSNRVLLYPQV